MSKKELLASMFAKGISYGTFLQLTKELLNHGKTTGTNQGADYVNYTKLNIHRMKRLDKSVEINDDLKTVISKIKTPQTWLVISEAWCGDAAQNVPLLQKMADLSDHIELKIILRDENLEVMDLYLTNGSQSIPKLIALENKSLNELYTWGPRPATIQNIVNDFKLSNTTEKSVIKEKIQIAYNHDKSLSIQNEFFILLTNYLNLKFN